MINVALVLVLIDPRVYALTGSSALWSRPRQTSLRPPHVVVAPALAGIAFSFAPVLYIHQYLGGDDTTGPAKPLLKLTFHKPALHKLPPAAAEKNTYFIAFKPSHTRVRAAAAAFHGGLRRASICAEQHARAREIVGSWDALWAPARWRTSRR